jgi:hypothetical protein
LPILKWSERIKLEKTKNIQAIKDAKKEVLNNMEEKVKEERLRELKFFEEQLLSIYQIRNWLIGFNLLITILLPMINVIPKFIAIMG